MTTNAHERPVPPLTLAWRLKMALAYGDVSRDEMAEYLGVSTSSISRWCNDDKGEKGEKDPPKRAYLVSWSVKTGVSVEWLETGEEAAGQPTPPDGGDRAERLRQLADARRARTRRAGRHATAGYLDRAA